jgi:hypothetical protein
MSQTKYRLAICQTKPTPRGKLITQAIARGIERTNDAFIIVDGNNARHLEILKRCDTLIQICDYNGKVAATKENSFRKWCKDKVGYTLSKRRLILDVGFVKNHTDTPDIDLELAYWSIGFDGIKGEAKFYNENSPSDRWNSFNIDLKPWRESGEYVLILGQNESGISTQHMNYVDWMNNTVEYIKSVTDRPIKFMAHRHQTVFPNECEVIKNKSIYENCENAWCTIARTTNGAAGSIISGVPVITEDQRCITYSISDHLLDSVNFPTLFDRQQWCNDIGYSQWNIKEIKRGEMWNHLRGHIYDTTQ